MGRVTNSRSNKCRRKSLLLSSLGRPRLRRDVQLLPSSYLLRFGFLRPNCARKQNSRQATDRVFDVGSTECPGPEPLNTTIHSMRNYGNSFWSVVIQRLIRRTASPNHTSEVVRQGFG